MRRYKTVAVTVILVLLIGCWIVSSLRVRESSYNRRVTQAFVDGLYLYWNDNDLTLPELSPVAIEKAFKTPGFAESMRKKFYTSSDFDCSAKDFWGSPLKFKIWYEEDSGRWLEVRSSDGIQATRLLGFNLEEAKQKYGP